MLGLAGATIDDRLQAPGELALARTLDFGSFKVRDRVRLTNETESVTEVEAGAGHAASRLTIRIEEPAAGQLFLRFTYELNDDAPESATETLALRLREQAYKSADIDTVWRIRDLVERGELG